MQCNFLGQRDRSAFIVPEQRDNRTSLKSCYGTGRPEQPVKIWDGTRDGKTIFFCQNPGRDVVREGAGQSLFFSMISCFRTSFPVLERPFMFLNVLSCFRTEKKSSNDLMIFCNSTMCFRSTRQAR